MESVRIIYTPDASKFKLNEFCSGFPRYKGDGVLQKIRENYDLLRKKIPDVPLNVGVVTVDEVCKKMFDNEYKKTREVVGDKRAFTRYVPLLLLKEALELKKEDCSNPLTEQYVYRKLTSLFSDFCFACDHTLPPQYIGWIILFPNIPSLEGALKYSFLMCEEIGQVPAGKESVEGIKKSLKDLESNTVTWKHMEEIYEYFSRKFSINKVSFGFPIYYVIPESFPLQFGNVSLVERTEEPIFDKAFLEILKEGAKVTGKEKTLEDLMSPLLSVKDYFAETKYHNSFCHLVEELPKPRTILTDIYLADCIPKLEGYISETFEYAG